MRLSWVPPGCASGRTTLSRTVTGRSGALGVDASQGHRQHSPGFRCRTFPVFLSHTSPQSRSSGEAAVWGGWNIKNLTPFHIRRFNVFQGCPTLGAGGNSMDDEHIRVRDRLKSVAFVPLLAAWRAFTFLPRCLRSPETIR